MSCSYVVIMTHAAVLISRKPIRTQVLNMYCQKQVKKRQPHHLKISGVAGLSQQSPLQSIATFNVASTKSPDKKLTVSAIVVPCVTCDLLVQPVHHGTNWNHLSALMLADPDFGTPGKLTSYLVWTCTLMYS